MTAYTIDVGESAYGTDEPVNQWIDPTFEYDTVADAMPAHLSRGFSGGAGDSAVYGGISSTWANRGTKSMRLAISVSGNQQVTYGTVHSASSGRVPVIPGADYIFTSMTNVVSNVNPNAFSACSYSVQWQRADLSTARNDFFGTKPNGQTGIARFSSSTMVAPQDAVWAIPRCYIQVAGGSYPQGAGTIDVHYDDVYFGRRLADPSRYISGDEGGGKWTGTAGASSSSTPLMTRAMTTGRATSDTGAGVDDGLTTLIPNPSFETDLTGWAIYASDTDVTIARSTAWSSTGAASMKITCTPGTGFATTPAGASGIAVQAESIYTLSYTRNVLSGANSVCYVQYFNAAGTSLGQQQLSVVSSNGITRTVTQFRTPALCAFVAILPGCESAAADQYVDGFMLSKATIARSVASGRAIPDFGSAYQEQDNRIDNPTGVQGVGSGTIGYNQSTGSVVIADTPYGSRFIRATVTNGIIGAGPFFTNLPTQKPRVTVGQQYTAACNFRALPAGVQGRVTIEWKDDANSTLLQSGGSLVTTSGISTVTATAPTNATNVTITCYCAQAPAVNDQVDVYACGFWPGTSQGLFIGSTGVGNWLGTRALTQTRIVSDGARAEDEIFNLCINPSLESNNAGWTGYMGGNSAVVNYITGDGYNGTHCHEVTGTVGASPAFGGMCPQASLCTGERVYLRGAAKIVSSTLTVASLAVNARYLRVDGAYNGETAVASQGSPTTGVWYDMSGNIQPPAHTAKVHIHLIATVASGAVVVARYDAAVISRQAAAVTAYVDGQSAGWRWLGTTHSSVSATTALARSQAQMRATSDSPWTPSPSDFVVGGLLHIPRFVRPTFAEFASDVTDAVLADTRLKDADVGVIGGSIFPGDDLFPSDILFANSAFIPYLAAAPLSDYLASSDLVGPVTSVDVSDITPARY